LHHDDCENLVDGGAAMKAPAVLTRGRFILSRKIRPAAIKGESSLS
jgi:hypothetical protein